MENDLQHEHDKSARARLWELAEWLDENEHDKQPDGPWWEAWEIVLAAFIRPVDDPHRAGVLRMCQGSVALWPMWEHLLAADLKARDEDLETA